MLFKNAIKFVNNPLEAFHVTKTCVIRREYTGELRM